MACEMKIAEKRVILNVQQSKIGFGYPRLFIEFNEKRYVNIDVALGAAFKMKKEDFEDWASDAEKLETEEDIKKAFHENNISYEAVEGIIKSEEL